MDNGIGVNAFGIGMVRKNCPTFIMAMKNGNIELEESNKTKIFLFSSSCGNLANSYLLQCEMKIIILEYIWILGGLKRLHYERNLAMSVDVDNLSVAFQANRGDPITIGACPLLIPRNWHKNIGGKLVQWRQLARAGLVVFSRSLHGVRMKNTGEVKRLRRKQSCTIL